MATRRATYEYSYVTRGQAGAGCQAQDGRELLGLSYESAEGAQGVDVPRFVEDAAKIGQPVRSVRHWPRRPIPGPIPGRGLIFAANCTIQCNDWPFGASHGQVSDGGSIELSMPRRFGKMMSKPTLRVALVDVDREHESVLRQACLAAGYSPVFKTLRDASSGGLEQWADLVLVESDLGFRALHAAEEARRAGSSAVGVLVNWWSDLERDARQSADFVLHVPLTSSEIRDVLTFTVPDRTNAAPASVIPRAAAVAQARAAPARPVPAVGFR